MLVARRVHPCISFLPAPGWLTLPPGHARPPLPCSTLLRLLTLLEQHRCWHTLSAVLGHCQREGVYLRHNGRRLTLGESLEPGALAELLGTASLLSELSVGTCAPDGPRPRFDEGMFDGHSSSSCPESMEGVAQPYLLDDMMDWSMQPAPGVTPELMLHSITTSGVCYRLRAGGGSGFSISPHHTAP